MGDNTTEPTRKKFPGYEFDTFDGCVTAFTDEPSIDDAEAFCAWLDEEGAEALSDPNAEEVLAGLEVEFVSAVGRPAQDSEWLIAKNQDDPAGDRHRWQSEADLYVRKDDDAGVGDAVDADAKQVAFAPVLVPKEADKDGDVIPRPAIEDAAHNYLAEYRKVDSDHDLRDGKGTPVESWTLKNDTTFKRPDGTESREYPAGTWVMGIKFDDETWGRVEEGDLTGLSIYGGAKPIDAEELREGAKNTNKEMTDKNDGECATCDVDGVELEVAKSEDDIPEWFVESHKREDDPCWENYVMVGMKPDPNGSGEVPNCVPEEDADEPDLMGSADMGVVDAWNEYVEASMANESDPDETGKDDGGIEKQIDANAVSGMLMMIQESDGLSPDSSVKDFVISAVESGEVDEAEMRNMSVLLADDMGGGDDDDDDDEDDDEEMATDDGTDDAGIDLDVDDGKSEDGVDKSVDDDRIDTVASAVESLAETVDALQKKVEDAPFGDKMENDDLSDRIAKELTGKDDPDVARKAVREQVAKNDDGGAPEVDYEGITEDTDADDGGDTVTSNHSAAANTRMSGGD
jgi:hypothetical protein